MVIPVRNTDKRNEKNSSNDESRDDSDTLHFTPNQRIGTTRRMGLASNFVGWYLAIMSGRCLSCEITSGQKPVLGGTIFETERFHTHQDVAYPIVGQVILAAKRHFRLLTEMTTEESAEFLPLVQRLRNQQTLQLGIEHVYYFYNEDTKHHFHLWMVPRHPWMAQFGKSIAAVRPALVHARDQMNSKRELEAVAQAAEKLRVGMNDR